MAEISYSIGEVVAQLQARQPEVTPSMVRFWEREGLLTPTRTTGGHRVFCQADLDRLHLIADLRQRRYLPLGAVKRILQELEADPTADLSLYDELFRPDAYDPEFVPLSRAQAMKQTGLSRRQFEHIERAGFLPASCESDHPRSYDEDDLRILAIVSDLLQAGLVLEELTFYAQDVREHVRNETHLLSRALGSCDGEPERHATYREVQRAAGQLRACLYRKFGRQAMRELLEEE